MVLERLSQLEPVARRLDPGPEERQALLQRLQAYSESFLQSLDMAPSYQASTEHDDLFEAPFAEAPLDMQAALELFDRHVVQPGINTTSARLFGYIPGGGLYPAALGDFLAAVTNRYAGVYFGAPGAVRMENQLLEWMAGVVGYPTSAGGNLTSGGSLAHLVAVVTAREAFGLRAADFERAVVYLSEQTHHSVAKALHIAGLGGCHQRLVPLDEGCRMQAEALVQAIAADRQAGRLPWLVVASAGTTDTGAVDPLETIAQIAADQQLWLHVDGAYGAFFALCEPGRRRLAGMGASDSIILDPHKGLFLPYGSGAVLVKDARQIYNAHQADASYMQDVVEALDQLSPADLSPELTKHFRGPRLWLPLKLFGTRPFAAALEEKLLLARYFYDRLGALESFERGPVPDLSIVTFRVRPPRGDPEAFNQKLVRLLQERGRVFLSSTRLQGRFTLRLAVLSFRSHLDDIELALEELQEASRLLVES